MRYAQFLSRENWRQVTNADSKSSKIESSLINVMSTILFDEESKNTEMESRQNKNRRKRMSLAYQYRKFRNKTFKRIRPSSSVRDGRLTQMVTIEHCIGSELRSTTLHTHSKAMPDRRPVTANNPWPTVCLRWIASDKREQIGLHKLSSSLKGIGHCDYSYTTKRLTP